MRRSVGSIQAAALKLPGVAVMTGADLQAAGVKPILNPRDSLGAGFPSFANELVIPPWRALAVDKVRHVGEAVALVVAPTESGARDAAEAVQVDYDPLSPVIEIEDAEKVGAPLVWDELRGNQLFAIEAGDKTATDAAFARAAAGRRDRGRQQPSHHQLPGAARLHRLL